MKSTAVILILGLLLPLANGLAHHSEPAGTEASVCCHHSGHAGQVDDQDHENRGKEGHQDHPVCPFGCNCNCCIHVVAFVHEFTCGTEILNRPFQYNLYSNDYHFDLFIPVFEPPRLG